MDKIISVVHIYTSCNKCLSQSPETAFNSWALVKIQTAEVINCTNNCREKTCFPANTVLLTPPKARATCKPFCYELTDKDYQCCPRKHPGLKKLLQAHSV